MNEDVSSIREVVAKARRRIRIQTALEGATTAFILAIAMALVVVCLLRTGVVEWDVGLALFGVAGSIVGLGALTALLRRRDDDETIARRIDRASHTSDRLSSALAFEHSTGDFERAAIRDALQFVDVAEVVEATPYRIPRDARFAAGFLAIAIVIGGIALPGPGRESESRVDYTLTFDDDESSAIPHWDLGYAFDTVADLKRIAGRDHHDALEQLADALEAQLRRLAHDEIEKLELLSSLEQGERAARSAGGKLSDDASVQLGDVREAIRRLKPSPAAMLRPRPTKQSLAAAPPQPQPLQEPPRGPSQPGPTSGPSTAGTPGGPSKPRPDGAGPGLGPDVKPGGKGGLEPKESKEFGDGPGQPPLGDRTESPQPTRDVMLAGKLGNGSSVRSTIKTAAQQGFATVGYTKVYATYNHQVEEVMRAEQVPSTYRYYIKRYFRKIKPD